MKRTDLVYLYNYFVIILKDRMAMDVFSNVLNWNKI